MAYISDSFLFRSLDDAEEAEFRAAARTNYNAMDPINSVWHPVYQDECRRMNREWLAASKRTDTANTDGHT